MAEHNSGLRGMLRKAASLVVVLPEEEEPAEFHADVTPEQRAAALKEIASARRPAPPAARPAPAPAAAPAKTVAQIAREQPGPNLEDIKVHPEAAQQVPVSPEGDVDFASVFKAAGVQESGLTAEQVLDMIAQLPANLPMEARRQMVRVSISTMGKALGVTPEGVVADASRKLAAIAAYAEQQQSLTQELIARSNEAIAEMEARIAERRQKMAAAQAHTEQVAARCKAEADRLDDILEFLSEDIPPSRNAPAGS